ncbi:hypothetical protein GCM10009007_02690 [Formosimonas limnophila]|uniref:EF-hand domain-containing protein n=1 Tax=Formosimonas limnophila TaxID=1384487 RepID=A0A8J3CM87_9BURK|nr:EF-hand domain-containing protein [Formosimonas limnophila]GHA65543.1 hypothetical protein GCM10009007_02690 [Formosimonas limnophila]
MKPINKTLFTLGLTVFLSIVLANTSENVAKRVQALDTDKDGGVSLSEAKAGKASRIINNFTRLDSNKDGKVTVSEIEAAMK